MSITILLVLIIVVALFFDFTNGFHDTANAMATSIATGALKPKVAVALAGILIGAAIAAIGFDGVVWGGVLDKIILPALFAPFVAGLILSLIHI